MKLGIQFWEPHDRTALEAEAIRRGWLSPDYPHMVDWITVKQTRPRDTSIVTFSDWLLARPGRVVEYDPREGTPTY